MLEGEAPQWAGERTPSVGGRENPLSGPDRASPLCGRIKGLHIQHREGRPPRDEDVPEKTLGNCSDAETKTPNPGSGGWVSKPCPGQPGGPAGFSARQ